MKLVNRRAAAAQAAQVRAEPSHAGITLLIRSAFLPGAIARLVTLMGSAAFSRLGQVLLAIVLARAVGPESYGRFIFSLGLAVLLTHFSVIGLTVVASREIPRMLHEQDWPGLRGLMRMTDLTVLTLSALSSAALLLSAGLFPQVGDELQMAALLVVPLAFALSEQQRLIALGKPNVALLLDQSFASWGLALIVLLVPFGLTTALTVFAAFSTGSFVISRLIVRSRLPAEVRAASPRYAARSWLQSGASLCVTGLPQLLVTRFDVLLVAPLAGFAEAGLFSSALRVTMLLVFPQAILQALVSPKLSQAFAQGDAARARRLFALSILFALATAGAATSVILIAPAPVMAFLFGPGFDAGGPALAWLAIGQFFVALATPVFAVVSMGGNHHALAWLNVFALVPLVIAGLVFVPDGGARAAAIVAMMVNLLLLIGSAGLARRPLAQGPDEPGR